MILRGLLFALTALSSFSSATNGPDADHDGLLAPRELPGSGVALRLIPIGDSITKGWLSPGGNGYRLRLHNLLLMGGYKVDFIGSFSEGINNTDNQHEGWAGFSISSIRGAIVSDQILKQHPNVALIHAGTNDFFINQLGEPHLTAPDRLGTLIDTVLIEDPESVVLVAKIMMIGGPSAAVNAFNARVPMIVNSRRLKGYKVAVVDLSGIGGANETVDGVHPNDAGCKRMAQGWYNSILMVPKWWWAPLRQPS